MNGKVIGEFVCDEIKNLIWDYYRTASGDIWGDNFDDIQEESCLTDDEINRYFGIHGQCSGFGYGWHISDLKIYDRPRELNEFTGIRKTKREIELYEVSRPPQSWMYVVEREKI